MERNQNRGGRNQRGGQQNRGGGQQNRGGGRQNRGGGQQDRGESDDFSEIFRDRRLIERIVGPVINQKASICWAIVIARLLEAAYNLNIPQQFRAARFIEISFNDLVKKVKKDEKVMEVGSLKKSLKWVQGKGIAKKSPTATITWTFDTEENATRNFIEEKLERCPVGIILEIDQEFHNLRGGIYTVRRVQPDADGRVERHALMIIAHGRTPGGQRFLITQNSWDQVWGVNGYGRIAIEDDMRCLVFYPTPAD